MVEIVPVEFGLYYWAALIGIASEFLILSAYEKYLDYEAPRWIWGFTFACGALGVPAWLWFLIEVVGV